ncbi:STAS domain-containing protein [Nucisporomicrobium flavum]|uniref:STAS domain-containing protein n=1 Tax=Nucisporomicrobium flavum TaxID=2785915 RepID=UPI0018F48A1A|nr:STAS domain-containing protein [Nucisporomicrobium flavum]
MVPENSKCVVTIVARDDRTVWMRPVGALDIDADPVLAAAVTRLSELAPRAVVLDLAGVTFAGATLCHFLVRTRTTVPGAAILIRNASPQVQFVMTATGIDGLVVDGAKRLPRSAG